MKINSLRSGKRTGFTLIELLIVLLIIGLLSGVTLRAIDMTRERTMYSETTKKLNALTNAIVGDPDLISDGRRSDFGFVGDLGRLPLTLDELVKNTQFSTDWNGPYVKIAFLEDTVNPGYKLDEWGNEFEYSSLTGIISSRGNGQVTLTRKISDSLTFLFNNRVHGMITDIKNNPPGSYDTLIRVFIYLPNNVIRETIPNRSGYYQINGIPIGKHRIDAIRSTGSTSAETLVKWVSVGPKSNTPVDFKFIKLFRSSLQVLKPVKTESTTEPWNLSFTVFNSSNEEVDLDWLKFVEISKVDDPDAKAYCFHVTRQTVDPELWGSEDTLTPIFGIGQGGTVNFNPLVTVSIGPEGFETFNLRAFRSDSIYTAPHIDMNNWTFRILFSEGSLIKFVTEP